MIDIKQTESNKNRKKGRKRKLDRWLTLDTLLTIITETLQNCVSNSEFDDTKIKFTFHIVEGLIRNNNATFFQWWQRALLGKVTNDPNDVLKA